MSISDWIRQVLDFARRRGPVGSVDKKLEAIRKAVRHGYPTGDLDRIPDSDGSGHGEG
jgi:hypothetical protein